MRKKTKPKWVVMSWFEAKEASKTPSTCVVSKSNFTIRIAAQEHFVYSAVWFTWRTISLHCLSNLVREICVICDIYYRQSGHCEPATKASFAERQIVRPCHPLEGASDS